jgi:SAM-dependent methyltransferase
MAYTLNETLDKKMDLALPLLGKIHIPAVSITVVLFSMGLFTCCMVCHGELARLKPDPKYLTHFYLTMSAGGALGGLLVGLLAPHFLNALYEMPVSLVVCAALVSYVLRQDAELQWIRRWPGVVVTGALTLALAGYVGWQIRQTVSESRVMVRNFYGGLKVRDNGDKGSLEETRTLTHGTILHGEEYLHISRRDLPTTYYGPDTGIGLAIREKQKAGAVRIGVIGLGTGTTAAYGRLGDYIRYYEINPLVLELAKKWFYFLADCKASRLDVVMGDARLTLEQELKDGHPQNFDVLAVDAFSSDSIPVHLLTKEAMDLYFRHLRPDGILAVHISNRYLNLQPVLAGEVRATQKTACVVDTEDDETVGVSGATWVLITSPATGFKGEIPSNSEPLNPKKTVRLWTDDYSNLFEILK